MSTIHPHWDSFETFMPVELAVWWRNALPTAMLLLTHPKYRYKSYFGTSSVNLLIYPPELLIRRKILNGRKPKDQSRFNSSESSKPAPLEWLDGQLTPEDIDILERDTVGIEHLASVLVGLVSDGYGVSVKRDFERERFNCTIYRPPFGKQRRHLGLSGNSPDLRDALLVTLYRFEHKFGGVIDDSSPDDAHPKQARRFG